LPFIGGRAVSYFQGSFAEQYETRTENPFIVVLFDIEGLVVQKTFLSLTMDSIDDQNSG